MTADWGYMENASMGFDSSSDLFGGVLFGDELMDLYNPDGNARPTGASDTNQTIPNFVPKSEDKINNNQNVKTESKTESGGDLGAFRPSSSCSELDTLMPKNESTSKAKAVKIEPQNEIPTIPSPSVVMADSSSKNNTKKRSSSPSDGPSGESPSQKLKVGETTTSPASVASSPPIAPLPAPVPAPQQQQQPPVVSIPPTAVATTAPAPVAPSPRSLVPAPAPDKNAKAVPSRINKSKVPGNVKGKAPPVSAYAPSMVARQNSNTNSAVLLAKPPPHNKNLGIPHNNNALPRVNSVPQNQTLVSPPPTATNGAPARISMVAPPQVVPTNMMVPHVPPPPANFNAVVPLKQNQTQAKQQQQRAKGPEEQFKGVAQAAVSNLILSASGNKSQTKNNKKPSTGSDSMKAVDTSSAHIAALTSTNWVAACTASMGSDDNEPGSAEAEQAAALAAVSDPAAAKAARARRANLTPDERARQNRDRNREHARNTRLRKKAYVEELKKTLTELVAQRDASELEKRHEAQRDLEVREVRFRVMEEFLKLRACGGDAGLLPRWVAILDDGFTLTLPKTPYRHLVHPANTMYRTVSSDNTNAMVPPVHMQHTQVLKGATESMADAAKVSAFFNSLGNNRGNTSVPAISCAYHCDRKHFMMDNVTACLDWTLTTNGLIGQGVSAELCFKGTMRAKFCPASNKLASAELLFDTGSVMNQTKRSTTAFLSPASMTQYIPTPSPLSLQPAATAPPAPQVVKEVSNYEQQAHAQQPLQPQPPQQQQHQPLTNYNYSSTISVSSTDGNESSIDGNA